MDIPLTKEGYLQNQADWTPEVAQWLATQQGVNLTQQHWEIIYLIRDFYQQYQASPAIRTLVNLVKTNLGEEKANSIYLHLLFPAGPAKQATCIAGLPKPVRCI